MVIRNAARLPPVTARDGSVVTELLHPRNSAVERVSVARAQLEGGQRTRVHRHDETEEAYYILSGDAAMQVGGETERVGPGDAVLIPPGVEHRITCIGPEPLAFLCICAPAYRDEDTQIAEGVLT